MQKKHQLFGPFLWMGFNNFEATDTLRGVTLVFTATSPEDPGVHLIDLESMKD